MTLDGLNGLDRLAFVERVGWIFEHSPWVAERAWVARPFRTADALLQALAAQVERATQEERLALLRAHPDLGARIRLSAASASEQAGVGLDRLTQTEFDRFTALNERYRSKFGIPFLFAVKGSTKHQILAALERRFGSARDAELAEALQQVYRIAAFRLHDVLESGE